MDDAYLGRAYTEHLTDADLEFLASATGFPAGADGLRRQPGQLLDLLDRHEVFDALLGAGNEASGWLVGVTPFLTFAVIVHRSAAELAASSYLPERSGVRERIPVFDAPQLSEFLAGPARRLFLAELLASFARVASGRYRVRTSRGWRTRRFSELDPVRLAQLAETVPEAARPGAYRRLGDVALFLAGVFPDYTRRYALGPLDAARLLRAAGIARTDQASHERLVASAPIELFEHLGTRWYRHATRIAPVRSAGLAVVGDVADRFRQARRVLNHVADQHLFATGNPWFSPPSRS